MSFISVIFVCEGRMSGCKCDCWRHGMSGVSLVTLFLRIVLDVCDDMIVLVLGAIRRRVTSCVISASLVDVNANFIVLHDNAICEIFSDVCNSCCGNV